MDNGGILDINKLFSEAKEEEINKLIKAVECFQSLGIPCYKLKIGIVNAHAKYMEADSIVPNVEKPTLLKNTLQLYLLIGTDYEELNSKYNTESSPLKQQYFMNYITGKDNPSDLEVALLGEDNKVIQSSIIDDIHRKSTRIELFDTYLQELVSIGKLKQESYTRIKKQISNPLLEKANDELLTKINFILAQRGSKSVELLVNSLATYLRIQNTLALQQKELTEEVKEKRKSKLTDIVYEKVLSTNRYKKDSQTIVEYKNKLSQLRKDKTNIEQQLKKSNNEIEQVEHNINKLNDYAIYLQDKDPSSMIQRLENEKKQHKETLRNTIRIITRQVLFEQMGDKLYNLDNTNNPNAPKPITKLMQKDIVNLQDDLIMNIDKHQRPFTILIDAFKRVSKTGNEYIDWDAMYSYLKQYWRYIRITQVRKAEDTEGLAKQFMDYISVQDTNKYKNSAGKEVEWKFLTKKEQKKYYKQHQKYTEFNTFEDLQRKFKQATGKFKLKEKEYDIIGDDVNIDDFFTPTLKQIRIKSAEDLKTIYNILIEKGDKAPLIGFTYINDILDRIKTAYKPYRVDGFAAKFITKFNIMQKAALRLSSGFLLRNAMDVFYQLVSDMAIQKGLTPAVLQPQQLYKYIQYGDHIFRVYEFLNDERMFTLIHILNEYDRYNDTTLSVQEQIESKNIIYDYLERYIAQAQNTKQKTNAIQIRLARALKIQEQYKNGKNISKTLKQITEFLTNCTFAEYYLFYDNKIINGKPILGLRQDADKDNKDQRLPNKIKRIISQQDDLFKSLLIEVSAFMQTKAQVDMFKQKQYEELFKIVDQNKYRELNTGQHLSLDDIRKQVDEFRYGTTNKFLVWTKENVKDLYQNVTEYTENIARILGFILNRDLYGHSFDQSVQKSLKNWFNYGQRSPLEIQLSYDIPYISFPIRSISNWIDRILDPKYAVFMDDIIDGIYGQYADEDGQYSEWEQFMIKNGWIPLFNGLGIRAGNGAFDIMNLLSNPTENIKQRYNPILRGLSEFINSGDLTKATKQLASVGVMTRVANTIAPRSLNQTTGIGSTKPKTLANSLSMFFEYNENDYDKYIPYRYRYPNNGRYKYYENIYKDWFNKYGRMRKPTKDPVTLVNNIQWQQYLRYKRNQYRR
jgi:hypothetical protein